MRFRTEYLPGRAGLTLDPRNPVALIGSCFTQNIAGKMTECGWMNFCGAGTLYNPFSIANVIDMLLFSEHIQTLIEDSLFEAEGYVHSWLFDSHFSRGTREEIHETLKETAERLDRTLCQAQALIVTFGTAWCYFLKEKDYYVVSNCHKMPQDMFERKRLSVGETADMWVELCERIKSRYPHLKVIFTVSPVRHMKDGFEGNARSKASLLLAVEEICAEADNALYFPAYEIVNDDLRDYRFYAEDLVHPSGQAVEYIWEMFRATYIDSDGEALLKAGNKEFKRRNHRSIQVSLRET